MAVALAKAVPASFRQILWERVATMEADGPPENLSAMLGHRAEGSEWGKKPIESPVDRAALDGYLKDTEAMITFFDVFGWDREDERDAFELPPENIPLVLRALSAVEKSILKELEDRDQMLVRLSEDLKGGEWEPKDSEDRDLADELFEQRHAIQAIRRLAPPPQFEG
jgi:hypothetical protein